MESFDTAILGQVIGLIIATTLLVLRDEVEQSLARLANRRKHAKRRAIAAKRHAAIFNR